MPLPSQSGESDGWVGDMADESGMPGEYVDGSTCPVCGRPGNCCALRDDAKAAIEAREAILTRYFVALEKIADLNGVDDNGYDASDIAREALG